MTEVEPKTLADWLNRGTVLFVERGEENTYAEDEFGRRFFAKGVSEFRVYLRHDRGESPVSFSWWGATEAEALEAAERWDKAGIDPPPEGTYFAVPASQGA